MYKKGFDFKLVEQTIADLKSDGLQCDECFAEYYIRHREEAGFGQLRIVIELKQRAVSNSIIQRYVYSETKDWFFVIYKTWKKKLQYRPSSRSKDYLKQMRFLRQRGFEQSNIHQLLRESYEDK